MTEADFISTSDFEFTESGKVSWQSPSNIALVKYWGKHGIQLPSNPSVSFTLSKSNTSTSVSYQRKESLKNYSFEVYLDGASTPSFKPKIEQFFERVISFLPFLKHYHFDIHTSNSFPHSSGIASSASGMSALALCLLDIERNFSTETRSEKYYQTKASFLSRLGSGSACRSIEGPLVVWGEHSEIPESSDLFGTKYPFEVHRSFNNFQDTILLIDKGEKQVSSTVGHGLMKGHPYAANRFQAANKNLGDLISVFSSGDLDRFIAITESEALQLHAMMMASQPYFILMKPNTLHVLNKVWQFRKESSLPLCFTLDAGANVHLLYPENIKAEVMSFITSDLVEHCKNGEHIIDHAGNGAFRN